jgi:low temperature requirement protein LtrA
MSSQFKKWLWLPPRAHGDVIEDRTVSFLELFYDLVYVVVIARLAHTLAEDVSWRAVGEFAVVFGLIWIAWWNGTLYYELHGREDGRTRTFVFVQMLLLALLAVFAADASGEGGRWFALVYTAFLMVVTWLWYTVRRQDSEEYNTVTSRFLSLMMISIAVIAGSAFLPEQARIWVWAGFVVAWVGGALVLARILASALDIGVTSTESMAERFALFIIIVLGEVVVGAVDGISHSERTVSAIATGTIGLMIGFAFWWTYFDFVGRRLPVDHSLPRGRWMFAHLPLALSIAATGAALVSLVEHATDQRSPAATSWLLSGSTALGLLALVAIMRNLQDYERLPTLYRPVSASLIVASAVALAVGWLRPAPWLLTLSLVLILAAVWALAVWRWLHLDDPTQALPGTEPSRT